MNFSDIVPLLIVLLMPLLLIAGLINWFKLKQEQKNQHELLRRKLSPTIGFKFFRKPQAIEPELNQMVRQTIWGRLTPFYVMKGEYKGLPTRLMSYHCDLGGVYFEQQFLAIQTAGLQNPLLFFIHGYFHTLQLLRDYEFIDPPAGFNYIVQIPEDNEQQLAKVQQLSENFWQTLQDEEITIRHNGQWLLIYRYQQDPLKASVKGYNKFLDLGVQLLAEFHKPQEKVEKQPSLPSLAHYVPAGFNQTTLHSHPKTA